MSTESTLHALEVPEQPLQAQTEGYDESSIKVLKGLEAVRVRPGMYIGDTDDGTGLHNMVREVVDNAIDEASAGFCSEITVTINNDHSVTIKDNGRGIPTGLLEEEGNVSAATIVMTMLHAGGKFGEDDSYKASGGLHGVGVSVVNALSTFLKLTIHREGETHFQEFKDGEPVDHIKVVGKTDSTGTEVCFKPSPQIFTDTEFHYAHLHSRLRELAFLCSGVRITLTDDREGAERQDVLFYEGGVSEFVALRNQKRKPLHDTIINIQGEIDGVRVDAAMQWSESFQEDARCYTNTIFQSDGGTHASGFKSAVTRTLKAFLKESEALKNSKVDVIGEDTREGLTTVLSVRVHEPKFSSQTKDKLVSSDVEGPVTTIISNGLKEFLQENPKEAKQITEKIVEASKARDAARKAKEIVRKTSLLGTAGMPGKLADCQETRADQRELFLVEGESAGGSAKQARDRLNQAVLPLKGKILNVEKAREHQVLSSQEIVTLITALGTGIGEEDFDLEKLRYHRIIIMTDADVDGSHIRTLLLTFFYRLMPKVVEHGHLYIAQPPLYKVTANRKERYLNDEKDFQQFMLESALDGSEIVLRNREGKTTMVGKELEDLCEIHARAKKNVELVAMHHDKDIIEALSVLPSISREDFSNEEILVQFKQQLTEILIADSVNGKKRHIELIPDAKSNGHEVYALRVDTEDLGITSSFVLNRNFVDSVTYRSLTAMSDLQQSLVTNNGEAPVKAITSKKSSEHNQISDAIDWLLDETRKGISIQRYKGLGEMNADQLRETTMDINSRSLRKVQIDDELTTQDTFVNLMGEVVKPRREFIEENAFSVVNLDI